MEKLAKFIVRESVEYRNKHFLKLSQIQNGDIRIRSNFKRALPFSKQMDRE